MGDLDKEYSRIPILIPAYRPDNSLLRLLRELDSMKLRKVVVVDDGSGAEFARIFDHISNEYGCKVVHHSVNLGKGRAIKTGFNYIMCHYPEALGCVTTDCNGSFLPEDIKKIVDTLIGNPSELIMGSRVLKGSADYVGKAVTGYKVLQLSFKYLVGFEIHDPQCVLRGIPISYMKKLMNVWGEGYEFDTKMITSCKKFQVGVREVGLSTKYEKRRNVYKYRTIKDNIPIYLTFASYIFTSIIATVVDLVLFQVLKGLFNNISVLDDTAMYIPIATGLARTVSAFVNYKLNLRLVFRNKKNSIKTLRKWIMLVIVQAAISAAAVTIIHTLLPWTEEVLIKVPVDFILFFLSYYVAKEKVYG